jgi:hypothetical protein
VARKPPDAQANEHDARHDADVKADGRDLLRQHKDRQRSNDSEIHDSAYEQ